MKRLTFLLLALSTCAQAAVESYPVTWKSPSQDSLDSMPPSGRRGAGANVWVQDGSIWLYLAHNGAYDSHGRLLKLGCVRLTPKDLDLGGAGWSQTLDPASGTISARGTTIGADKTVDFAPVRAREIRLHVLKAKRPININEFEVFAPSAP